MKRLRINHLLIGLVLLGMESIGWGAGGQGKFNRSNKPLTSKELLEGKVPIPSDGKVDAIMIQAYQLCLMIQCMKFRRSRLMDKSGNLDTKEEIERIDEAIEGMEKMVKTTLVALKAAYFAFSEPAFVKQVNDSNWESILPYQDLENNILR